MLLLTLKFWRDFFHDISVLIGFIVFDERGLIW